MLGVERGSGEVEWPLSCASLCISTSPSELDNEEERGRKLGCPS